jgi:PAS domain S-box-containing protein
MRLDALNQYEIMDSPPESQFDDIANLASIICRTPIATVTFLDDRRQWFKARVGMDASETPIEHAFCAHAIRQPGELLVVPDATADLRFRSNPFVIDSPKIRFYAGAPVVNEAGVAIGTVCAIDCAPRRLRVHQRAALTALARQAMTLLQGRLVRHRSEILERSESYFRHLTEYALDLITILDPDGTIRFESRSIERELGHIPEHYRGRNAFEFVHPDDLPLVMNAFLEAVRHNGNTPVIRFRFRHKDGTYRVLEGSGNNLIEDPAVRGIVFNSRDVTERLQLQEDIERSRVEKEETIGILTGGVAHDFNNILTSIQGHAELTAARVSPGSAEARYLSDIQAAAARAAGLTRQLLAFSHRVILQPRAVDIDLWLRGIEATLKSHVGAAVEVRIVTDSGAHVYIDPDQFEQVVVQIVTNASEAMPNGGCITIETASVIIDATGGDGGSNRGDGPWARLTISDQGGGIAENTLDHIFDPYFTTKTAGAHSGLGLSMCRGIVEQSGGRITARNRPGGGAAFDICLNVVEAVETRVPPLALPEWRCPGVATILFVDDEPLLREIGQITLSEAGYNVVVAEDGHSALERLSELGGAPLDVLVTDVLMPGMTGVQLAEEICRRSPRTRVLLCSGYTRDTIAFTDGLPPGVAFQPKPYSLAALLDKVGELLGSPMAA